MYIASRTPSSGCSEQDRERAMTQRALERRRLPRAGSARATQARPRAGGGISGFVQRPPRGWSRPPSPTPSRPSLASTRLHPDRPDWGMTPVVRRPVPSSCGMGRRTPGHYHPGHGSAAVQPGVRRPHRASSRRSLATADVAASGRPPLIARRRRGGRRQEPPRRRARRPAPRSRLARPRGRLGGPRRRRPAVRPDRRGAARPRPRGRPERIAAAAGASLPELARLVPELSGVAGVRPGPSEPRPTGSRSGSSRASCGCSAGSSEDDTDPPRRRGPPLGRPLDPRPARVPRPQRARRAAAHRRHVPDR